MVSEPEAVSGPEEAQQFEWRASTPEAQGVDSGDLVQALQRVVEQNIELHGLIVYRNGHVILEVYPPPYDVETVHNIKSVSKSLLSALVGIAIDRGILSGTDQRVLEFFPEYVEADDDSSKQDITIHDLLTMTSGLDLDENGPLMTAVFTSDDWVHATLQRPQVDPPGQRFVYSTALTHLMSGLLSRASATSLWDFCQRYLCGPLGFENMQWRIGPSGYYFGGAELYLRPRDMLKFGVLYLDEGEWQGQQLVPRSWVRESTINQLGTAQGERPYGYWWWPVDNGYLGIGWGGQRLLVVPDRNLVIAATFAEHDGFDRMFAGFDFGQLSMAPLAPNPMATETLRTAVHNLAHPPSRPVPPLPDMARTISGKTFSLSSAAPTPSIKLISFDFSRANDYRLSIDSGSTSRQLALGLDGRFRTTSTGKFGPLPGDNRIALRGQWTNDTTFELELAWVGEPLRNQLTLSFGAERVTIQGWVYPGAVELNLVGTLLQRPN